MTLSPLDVIDRHDGTVAVVSRAPKDGAGRNTSASDLTHVMSYQQFSAWLDRLIYFRAGLPENPKC